jgi:hypothetical protein
VQGHEHAGVGRDDLRDAPDPGGDGRDTGRHRPQQRRGRRTGAGGVQHQVRRPEQGRGLLVAVHEPDALGQVVARVHP